MQLLLRKSLAAASSFFGIEGVSFKQRVLKAGLWSVIGFALSMSIRFGSNLLMTRLLMPDMFGVMAIASTVMVGLAMFSDVGLKLNIVQSARGNDPTFLNTAWAIQILRGLVLWFLAVCISLAIEWLRRSGGLSSDSVYAAPSLPLVIAILSFSAVFQGFESTKLCEASRGLSLGLVTRIEIASQIAGLACMISWACIDRSIWALVAGNLSSSMVRAVLSHAWMPGVANRWLWEKTAAHEVLHFGKWIVVASMLGFLVNSGDRLLLGGLVDSTLLGLYSIALLIATSVEGILSKIMGDVSFPAFSEVVRERRADLKQTYYRFYSVIASVAYFSAGFFATFGQPLINLLYDRRYHDAGWMLQLLSAILLTIPFRLATQTFLALGLPKLQSNIVLVRLVVLFVGTPVGFHYCGFGGAIAAIVASHFSSIPVIIFYNVRHGLFDWRRETQLLTFVLGGVCAGIGLALLLRMFSDKIAW